MKRARFAFLVPALLVCAGVLVGAPESAEAALIKLEYPGNDCSGTLGTPPNCSFNGSPLILKYAPGENPAELLINSSVFPTIDGSEFEFSNNDGVTWVGLAGLADDGWGVGLWRYTPGDGDPAAPVRYWSVKATNNFNVFFLVPDAAVENGGACFSSPFEDSCLDQALNTTTGSWVSPNANSLSHILFLDTQGGGGDDDDDDDDDEIPGVPEPATLALIGLALFGLAASRRRSR